MRFVISTALIGAAAACASGQLFGVGGFGPFATQSLYTIDASTGAATLVGNTGLTEIADIAYDPFSDRMYALTRGADLYTLNRTTGAATLLASVAGTQPEGSLAFDLAASRLLATRSDELGVVNTATAAFSAVGGPGATDDNDFSGLAFNGLGVLYAYAKNGSIEDSLVRIDPTTGVATRVGLTGISSFSAVGGLAFDPVFNGMYLTSGSHLYRVDVNDGSASLIGSHGSGGFSGIAFIPSPGAGMLLGLAAVAAGRRRR